MDLVFKVVEQYFDEGIQEDRVFMKVDLSKSPSQDCLKKIHNTRATGYTEHEGFRAGICLPFRPYDLENDRPYRLVEVPLTIMDGTLDEQYRKLNREEAWNSILSLLSTVKRFNGCIVLLWHNTHFSQYDGYQIGRELYKRSLDWIAQNGGDGIPIGSSFEYCY